MHLDDQRKRVERFEIELQSDAVEVLASKVVEDAPIVVTEGEQSRERFACSRASFVVFFVVFTVSPLTPNPGKRTLPNPPLRQHFKPFPTNCSSHPLKHTVQVGFHLC